MCFYVDYETDSNRTQIHLTLRNDWETPLPVMEHQQLRVVRRELYNSERAGLQRLQELENFTRMQLEKMIRRENPNWLDIGYRVVAMTSNPTHTPFINTWHRAAQ